MTGADTPGAPGAVAGWLIAAQPARPTIDPAQAERTREVLAESAAGQGWEKALTLAWPALAPIFAASPYLAGLARRDPAALAQTIGADPGERLAEILAAAEACPASPEGAAALRRLKGELHLLAALADILGAWDLDAVTGALTRFADAAVRAALAMAAREVLGPAAGEPDAAHGPAPGFFVIAMGKMGAFELNYSSDIDLTVFFDPAVLRASEEREGAAVAIRLTERLADILQARTAAGYVFRVDLRLRPDPASTAVAVSTPAALEYYESVGQNWERAAFIKARAVAGDLVRAEAFLQALQPFVWRRHLDFAAISDIQAIKRQIQAGLDATRLTAAGADLKLGPGGIREIEFFVQTQQLIAGGRRGELRGSRTEAALAALAGAGMIGEDAARGLAQAYRLLRNAEHRAQMINDEQTHRLPAGAAERRRIAALSDTPELRAFDAAVGAALRTVDKRYGELFASEEPLASRFGSLVFTGVEEDPETLRTLERMGFSDPAAVSRTIRAWHHGGIAATRTERGRELFTRLAPRLLEASRATGAPDAAFQRFAAFFAELRSGVQVQALFLARPELFELVLRGMVCAVDFARDLARRPAALDALLDPTFFAPLAAPAGLSGRIAESRPFEAAMDLARRSHREETFRIGMHLLAGVADADEAGLAFAVLADAISRGLAQSALTEVRSLGAAPAGEVALIALGKWGSQEMSARSDLDLMTLYGGSAAESLDAPPFFARFTQRLVAALSAPTAEGGLYEVDLQLRPSGAKGPVAVSLAAFEDYYAREAEVWELLAMVRSRVVWASRPDWAAVARAAVERALRGRRNPRRTAGEVRAMRALMAAERPASGFWDMKLADGGLVDIEFAAQHLQLCAAADGGPLEANTGAALEALAAAGIGEPGALADLAAAWRLQQALSQILKLALGADADPSGEPKALKALLAKAAGVRAFAVVEPRLAQRRAVAHAAFLKLVAE